MQDPLEGINEKMLWSSITESPRLAILLRSNPSQEPSEHHNRRDLDEVAPNPLAAEIVHTAPPFPDKSSARATQLIDVIQHPEGPPDPSALFPASPELPTEIRPDQPQDAALDSFHELAPPISVISAAEDDDTGLEHAIPYEELDIAPLGQPFPPALSTATDRQPEEPPRPAEFPLEETGKNTTEQTFLDSPPHLDQPIGPYRPDAPPEGTTTEIQPGNQPQGDQPPVSQPKDSVACKHGFSNDRRAQNKTNLVLGVAAVLAVLALLISILITWPTISQLLGFRGHPTTTSGPSNQPAPQPPAAQPSLEQDKAVSPTVEAGSAGSPLPESATAPSQPASGVGEGK